MRRHVTLLAMILLFLASPLFAGSLAKTRVSADADWVVHIDNARFAATEIGKSIRAELGALGVEQKLAGFAEIFGFHPLDDLQTITLYGTGPDESRAVALAEGRFDPAKLVALVSMNPMHEKFQHGQTTVHKWLDEKNTDDQGARKTMCGCVYKNRTVILSRGLDAVKNAVDVLDGSAKNAVDSLDQPALSAEGAFIRIVGTNIARMAAEQGQAAMLKQARSLSLAVGELDSRFYISASLTADNPEAAQAIGKMVDGIIAFMSLAQQEQPQLAQLAKAVKIHYGDKSVGLRMEVDSSKVVAFLKEQWQKEAQKKKAASQ